MSGKSKTIAVLGSGVDNPLPKQNLHLSNKILENGDYYYQSIILTRQ